MEVRGCSHLWLFQPESFISSGLDSRSALLVPFTQCPYFLSPPPQATLEMGMPGDR